MGIILFFGVLSFLIVFHEWGHYYAAKCLGIRVERFSIGFGPVLLRLKPKETEFCISAIPLGGYVKLAGEHPGEAKGEPWEFQSRPNHHKFLVVVAGPLLNAVLAIILFTGVLVIGQPIPTSRVGGIVPGFPAEAAGMQKNDLITHVNGQAVNTWQELLIAIRKNKDNEMRVLVNREGESAEFLLWTKEFESTDPSGQKRSSPLIGVSPSSDHRIVKKPFGEAFVEACKKLVVLTQMIISSLWLVITGGLSFKESLAGPIGIYSMTQQAAAIGFSTLLDFMARLSVSLFVINLFPIPVLDGGHLLFIIIESVIRRPINDKIKDLAMRVGMLLVLGLTFFVIYQDVMNFGIWDRVKALIGM